MIAKFLAKRTLVVLFSLGNRNHLSGARLTGYWYALRRPLFLAVPRSLLITAVIALIARSIPSGSIQRPCYRLCGEPVRSCQILHPADRAVNEVGQRDSTVSKSRSNARPVAESRHQNSLVQWPVIRSSPGYQGSFREDIFHSAVGTRPLGSSGRSTRYGDPIQIRSGLRPSAVMPRRLPIS